MRGIQWRFSALQRAEIAEIADPTCGSFKRGRSFSALQRAEIAEMALHDWGADDPLPVSVLFNEPKLLKFGTTTPQ